MCCRSMRLILFVFSAGDRPGRRSYPRSQPCGRRRYHSIARNRHRGLATGSSGAAVSVVLVVRYAVPGDVRAPTSSVLRVAERELLRYDLKGQLELDIVAQSRSRRVRIDRREYVRRGARQLVLEVGSWLQLCESSSSYLRTHDYVYTRVEN